MSTRAFIGVQSTDGTVRAIYCHSDGDIKGGVGETLYRHYQDEAKINALLDGGDISSLGALIGAPEGHSFSNPVDDCTVFYRRDRGETGVDAQIYNTTGQFVRNAERGGAYIYLYSDA